MNEKTPYQALCEAVEIIGGQTATAAICGRKVKQQHVHGWLNRSKRLPERYALKIEAATRDKGKPILARWLCPEMFEGISEIEDSAA